MAFADILIGAVSMPLTSVVDLLIVHQTFLHKVCILDLMGLAVMYFASTSVLSHLTVIAWERYMAIKKWRKYKSIATKRLAKKLALLAWLPAMCVAPPYILAGKILLTLSGCFLGICRNNNSLFLSYGLPSNTKTTNLPALPWLRSTYGKAEN